MNENYETAAFKINDRWKLSVYKINQMNADFAEKVNAYMADLKKHKVLDSNVGNRGFDYLSALLSIRRPTFGAARLQHRGMKPPAVLICTLKVKISQTIF